MLHTKSFLQRLSYMPWLLAACLALSWGAEEATAQTALTLTLDEKSVREDAGATTIKATVKAGAKVSRETAVFIGVTDSDNAATAGNVGEGLNKRYRIQLPTITIPKDKDTGTGDIILTPITDDRAGYDGQSYDKDDVGKVDVKITLTPQAGSGFTGTNGTATIILQDDDKPSSEIVLSLSKSELSQEADGEKITVTATLNGKVLNAPLSFNLISSTATTTLGTVGATEEKAVRDFHYTASDLGKVTIPARKISGTGTITIDPKKAGDNNKNAVFAVAGNPALFTGEDNVPSSNKAGNDLIPIAVNAAKFTIKSAPIAEVSGLTASPNMVRESAGRVLITLNVELKNPLTEDAEVAFTIRDSTTKAPGRRDVDYTASFEELTIPAGEKKGSTTLTLTTIDNKSEEEAEYEGRRARFAVTAKVGTQTTLSTGITITDDDAFSTAIVLEASPADIREDAGATEVTITATLGGKVLQEDAKLVLVLGNKLTDGATATRDVDYTATLRSVTIPAGELSGSSVISILPVDDGAVDADETIIIKTTSKPKNDVEDEIKINKVTVTLKDSGVKTTPTPDEDGDTTPKFSEDDAAASNTVIDGTVGAPLEHVLPTATGDGSLTYSVSTSLPAGLSFNSATRTISGTPTAAGKSSIVYTVLDGDTGDQLPRESAALTFKFEIEAMPAPTIGVASVTSTPKSVRENGEPTTITLTAKLASPATTAGKIYFSVANVSADDAAMRDVDYIAEFEVKGGVAIAAGATEASTTLVLTPIDDVETAGDKYLTVQASGNGGSASTRIRIADNEKTSTSILLEASPHSVSENAGQTVVTITATLDGKALDADATVRVSVDPTSVATRDEDYTGLFNPSSHLTIPAGSESGSISFVVEPRPDDKAEGNEAITFRGVIDGLDVDAGVLLISDAEGAVDEPKPDPLTFGEGTTINNISSTAEAEMDPLVLPEASGGSGDVAYSTSDLPAGLSFDPATRTISGTPEAATDGAVEVTYTVTDSAGASVSLSFSITVNAPLDFEEFDLLGLFGAFLDGAGKANPGSESAMLSIDGFVVGQPVAGLVLPAAVGGTAPLTYSLSPALPAGLSFDPVARTISGTPTAESLPAYTYSVADAYGAQVSLSLQLRPTAFALADNYPNPFNPTTTIRYALPQASAVELTVYNVAGQAVRTLVSEHQSAGRYVVEWDATNDSGQRLSSGLYFYWLQVEGQFHDVKKMLLLK